MNLQPRDCPLCSENSGELFAESNIDHERLNQFAYASRKFPEYMHHRLLLCRRCDLVYANPAPQPLDLETGYEAAAYDSQKEASFAAKTYAAQIRTLCQRLPDRIGALDIGAGDGAFCQELKSLGFSEIIGLEPSSAPIAAADRDIRSSLRQGMFQSGQFPRESFSLITCFQTIEHVSDPRGLCEEAVRLLKPGGALCLVAHNRRALSSKLLGRKSPIFDLEHLQLFSAVSLRHLFEKSGLRDCVVRPLYNRYPLAYWTKLFPFPAPVKRLILNGLNATSLGKIPVKLPAGNLVIWGFR